MSAPPLDPAERNRRHERLIRRWRDDADRAARNALIEDFMPLAVTLARRYLYTSEPVDDLVQVAALGLTKAVDGFDPDRGSHLAAFAIPTILGELRRYFRDAGWALHVPRRDKELAQALDETRGKLMSETGRAPTAQQLAQFMELDIEDVLRGLRALDAYKTLPFDNPDADIAGPGIADARGVLDPGFQRVEYRATVAGALRGLPEPQLRLLQLRFGEELSQARIAKRVGVSQMQVSRLLRRCFSDLRAQIDG